MLGYMHRNGIGTEVDLEEAVSWYNEQLSKESYCPFQSRKHVPKVRSPTKRWKSS